MFATSSVVVSKFPLEKAEETDVNASGALSDHNDNFPKAASISECQFVRIAAVISCPQSPAVSVQR